MKKIILFAAGILLLASTTLFGACQDTNNSPYKTFTMTEGIAHFSFEYSSQYDIKESVSNEDKGISYVTLVGPYNRDAKDTPEIGVIVGSPSSENYAEDKINNLITKFSDDPDFNLQELEQADLLISGIPAKLFVYQERDLGRIIAGIYAGVDTSAVIEVIREVLFTYNSCDWMIYIDSDSSTAEADKTDFDHVIQTFKILE